MATKNVVPRANGEGELGTSSKQWKKVNAQQFTGSLGVSASFFEGDGSRLTNVGGGSSFSVTGDVNNRVITADGSSGGVGEANLTFDGSELVIAGDVSASINVSASGFYGEKVYATTLLDTPKINTQDIHNTGNGNREIYISNNTVGILNDLRAGMNATPDTLVVDMSEQKVGVNYDLGDLPSLGAALNVAGDVSASINISASGFYGESAEITTITPTYIDGGTIRDSSGVPQAAAVSGQFRVLNNFVAGLNGSPDTFTVDRSAGKAAVNVDIASVSGLSADFTVVGDVSASINVSASAFYGDINVQQGTTSAAHYPIFVDGTTGEKTPLTDVSLAYNPSNNTLYPGNLQVSQQIKMSNTSAPSTPTGGAIMYAVSGEMYVKDTGGNETQISPHDEDGEWQYYSRNVKTGKVVRIRMEKMIRALEELTGQTFIEEE